MTTAHCWALAEPSGPNGQQQYISLETCDKLHKCYSSNWGSCCKWPPFLSVAFLWHQSEANTRGTLVEGENRTFCINTHCWTNILYRILHTDEYLSPCHVCPLWDEAPLQQLSMAGGCSRHLSLTVMKQPFNARRQPTRVESSLSQGVEVELSYS